VFLASASAAPVGTSYPDISSHHPLVIKIPVCALLSGLGGIATRLGADTFLSPCSSEAGPLGTTSPHPRCQHKLRVAATVGFAQEPGEGQGTDEPVSP